MKHIFIINPNSGVKSREKLLADIKSACEAESADYEIYYTTCKRDAERFVRERAEKEQGEQLRFYACGGDGTVEEVANGAFGFANAEVAAVPSGTGNDFIRNFSPIAAFSNIIKQIRGKVMELDLIRYNDRFAVNTINIGFDCSVVDRVEKMRRFPLIRGAKAYTICALIELVPMPKCVLRLLHGEKEETRRLTLCSIANGRFCGGGYKSNPLAKLDDGKLDVFLADGKVGRIRFLRMLGGYRKGTLLDSEKYFRFISYFQSEKLALSADKPIMFCADGEVMHADKLDLSVCSRALRFVVPEGANLVSV